VERVDRLPQPRLCLHVSQLAVVVHRNMDGVLVVRDRRLRRLRREVHRLRDVRLQLVVSLGGGLLLAMTSPPQRTSARSWVVMPALDSGTAATRPKYPLEGNALVLYRGAEAYVALEDRAAQDELAHRADVRLLTDGEALAFEHSLPFLIAPVDRSRDGRVGLGDVVSWFTRRLGIHECTGCRRRKRRLNRVVVWRWWARAEQ
jgi:hypothetical protein